jgi:glycosyltransferase involved in cell wall biosynthesis
MKLLFLDQFSQLGGAQQCLLDLLPAVQQAVVAIPGDGPMFERVRALGFETARIDCGPYASRTKTAGDLMRFVFEAPRLARQIRELAHAADLVYINGPRLLPAAALSNLRKPVVFHSHSYLPPGLVRKLSGLALRSLRAHVIASCRYVADPWKPYCSDISVIYNGVAGPAHPLPPRRRSYTMHDDESCCVNPSSEVGHALTCPPTERRSPRTAPRHDGEGKLKHTPPTGSGTSEVIYNAPFTIGCIGRIAPEKGQREFVEVARIVHGRLPEARFVIYGETMFAPQDYEREVRAAAAGLPVEFAGWVANVYDALANIDLLLVPSAPHEATTRVILEAFAAGIPVIAFPSGGIPEILEPSSLAHSIQEMADLVSDLVGRAPSSARVPPDPLFAQRNQQQGSPERPTGESAADQGVRPTFTVERYRTEIINVLDKEYTRRLTRIT